MRCWIETADWLCVAPQISSRVWMKCRSRGTAAELVAQQTSKSTGKPQLQNSSTIILICALMHEASVCAGCGITHLLSKGLHKELHVELRAKRIQHHRVGQLFRKEDVNRTFGTWRPRRAMRGWCYTSISTPSSARCCYLAFIHFRDYTFLLPVLRLLSSGSPVVTVRRCIPLLLLRASGCVANRWRKTNRAGRRGDLRPFNSIRTSLRSTTRPVRSE